VAEEPRPQRQRGMKGLERSLFVTSVPISHQIDRAFGAMASRSEWHGMSWMPWRGIHSQEQSARFRSYDIC
jgi:hypothetical protein